MADEELLDKAVANIESKIKLALIKKGMSQAELSDLIGENPQQVNRAINGWPAPKYKRIRAKIYRFLDL